jgi:hypothetical protein
MSIEYRDRSFSDIMPLGEALEQFQQELEEGVPVRSLHVGTESELKAIQNEGEVKTKLKELEEKIKEMSPIKTHLKIPTRDEIDFILHGKGE